MANAKQLFGHHYARWRDLTGVRWLGLLDPQIRNFYQLSGGARQGVFSGPEFTSQCVPETHQVQSATSLLYREDCRVIHRARD